MITLIIGIYSNLLSNVYKTICVDDIQLQRGYSTSILLKELRQMRTRHILSVVISFLLFCHLLMGCNPCYLERTDKTSILRCGAQTVEILPPVKGDIGPQGPTGKDGNSCTVLRSYRNDNEDTTVELRCGGNIHSIMIPRGQQGTQGSPGKQGAKGEKGEQGSSCSITRIEEENNGGKIVTITCGKVSIDLKIPGPTPHRGYAHFVGVTSLSSGDSGILKHRKFKYSKVSSKSQLRIEYNEHFEIEVIDKSRQTCNCLLEVKVDGESCSNPGLIGTYLHATVDKPARTIESISGYCKGTISKNLMMYSGGVEISIFVVAGKGCKCSVGYTGFGSFIEVTEVF